MSNRRRNDGDFYDPHRRPPRQHEDRVHKANQDNHTIAPPRDQYRRSPSLPRRYASPHDRYRNARNGNGLKVNNDTASSYNRPTRIEADRPGSSDGYRRGRSPSPHGAGRRGYRDRDREGYRSHGRDSRSRSRPRSPRRDRSPFFGGPPSREVILEGLPLDMVEDDIARELKQYHHVEKLDDIRVIRDRQTKLSRGFGFLRFPDLEKSKAFVERNYPMIYLYYNTSADNDDQAAQVRIAFSRERDDRNRAEKAEGEWTCKICTFVNFPGRTKCFRCQTPQIDMATLGVATASKPPEYLNSGDSDASPNGTPSQFLLLRGLEPTVTEDLLAKGVAKLYKPSRNVSPPGTVASKKTTGKIVSTTGDTNLGAREGSLRRVLLVRDRRSNESWRYGFAEFGTVEDAQAALTRFNSFEKFTISSKPVTADYIHAGVFVPVFNITESNARFTISPLGNTATKLAYWDEEAFVTELIVSSATPTPAGPTIDNQARSASDRVAATVEKEGLLKPGKETDAKVKKRKAEANDSNKPKKAAPAHLQFWSNRHAELHGVKKDSSPEKDSNSQGVSDNGTGLKSKASGESIPHQSFADMAKKCCYLCSRQFKTEAEVNKHERLSQLHRDNLNSADLVSKAQAKMAKAGISVNPVEDNSEYRDRAKERRAAFGASKKKISLPLKKGITTQSDSAEGGVAKEKEGDEDEEDDDDDNDGNPPVPSKGASLLGKMGWTAGEGLGAQGTGRVAPISTDMYVQGVGLGAEGGKIGNAAEEAERNTSGGYGEFLERTKDKAKERFERMG